MKKRWLSISRKLAPLLSAGVLLQATGCQLDATSIAGGLGTLIANNLISGLVFGVFNLGGP